MGGRTGGAVVNSQCHNGERGECLSSIHPSSVASEPHEQCSILSSPIILAPFLMRLKDKW